MRLPKEFSLGEIAALIDGKIHGSPEVTVKSVALSPLQAQPGDLALVFDPKLVKRLPDCAASAVIVPDGVVAAVPSIAVKRPLLALRKMLMALAPPRFFGQPGVHPSAVVDPTAEIAPGVSIGPNVVIGPGSRIGKGTRIMANSVLGGKVTVGEDSLIHPGCLVADYVTIGNRVVLQPGANLGSDGFGYVTERPSNLELRMAGIQDLSEDPNPPLKIPQIGTVIIEDDVEIGANSTIARATMGATVIGRGTKIDNLVMIAHNVRIGHEVLIVAHTSVAGSSTVGDRAVLAGHVGVKDHLKVGKDVVVEGKAGVMRDIPDREVVVGSPAVPAREHFTQLAHVRKLPQVHSDVQSLKKRVAELEAQLAEKALVR